MCMNLCIQRIQNETNSNSNYDIVTLGDYLALKRTSSK